MAGSSRQNRFYFIKGAKCVTCDTMKTEVTFHRKLRERELTSSNLRFLHQQFQGDIEEGRVKWFLISQPIVDLVGQTFRTLPANVFLRTGDAIHLATASEAGFKEI